MTRFIVSQDAEKIIWQEDGQFSGQSVEWKPGTEPYNRDQIFNKAQQALTVNATFLAIATPTAAQNAAQAKALTRQVNALIRLLLGALSDVSDT